MPVSRLRRYLRARINNPIRSGLAEVAGRRFGTYLSRRRARQQLSFAQRFKARLTRNATPMNLRNTAGKESGLTDRQPYVKRKGNSVKMKGNKKVKVSKDLKMKIQKTIAGNDIYGYFQSNQLENLRATQTRGQDVRQFPNSGFASYAGMLFDPQRILHCASRLWNRKDANITPLLGDTNNLPSGTTEVKVLKQWWTFRLTNNYSRAIHIRVFKCQSKANQTSTNATDAWSNGLANMFNNGFCRDENNTSVVVNDLYTTPKLSDTFNQFYKMDTITITLEPGQKYDFSVQGPAKEYDFTKFWNGGTYIPYQKDDVSLIWAINTDLAWSNTSAAPGRGTMQDTSESVFLESTYHCRMSMPENVLSTFVPAVLTNPIQVAQGRKKSIVIDDFTLAVANNTGYDRVDAMAGTEITIL